MGIVTLKIRDDLEERFRRKVSRVFGAGRGTLSKGVEESIRLWLEASPPIENREGMIRYWAELNGKKVAEDTSLIGLAGRLKKLGLDPRDVLLFSTEPRPRHLHLGFPTARTQKRH